MEHPNSHWTIWPSGLFLWYANFFKVGILFGGERAGLSNEDLFLAKKLIRVPTNPVFSSLNLAQSVLLISYQLNVCSIKQNKESSQTNVSVKKANYEEKQKLKDIFSKSLLFWLSISLMFCWQSIWTVSKVKLKGFAISILYPNVLKHLFSNLKTITGGAGLGRKAAKLVLLGFDFQEGLALGNFVLQKNQLVYLLSLILCIFAGLGVKNLTRSKTGRAYSAIRDGDIAAEAIGINLYTFKSSAFALSSFYAGVAGSLLFSVSGGVDPGTFNLLYSITFIAIVIIGGAGTVLGPLFGALFYILFPGAIQTVLHSLGEIGQGLALTSGQIERIIFGLFIILFLIFEPRGLWGIWFRLRNYFKAWPFSY